MTLTDAIDFVDDVLESHGLALPTEAVKLIIAKFRPDLIVIEAPVVTVEIAPGVDLAGLARHDGGDA